MMELFALFFAGCAIVIGGLSALFRYRNSEFAGWQGAEINLADFIELRGLNFKNFALLFSDSDYRILLAEPALARIAKILRKDRRRLALQWLVALRSDVLSLWRLRRLLTAYGISEDIGLELETTARIVSILVFISALRLCVFVFGPFAFRQIACKGRRYIETYSRFCQAALGRLPQNKWDAFSAEWQAQRITAA